MEWGICVCVDDVGQVELPQNKQLFQKVASLVSALSTAGCSKVITVNNKITENDETE